MGFTSFCFTFHAKSFFICHYEIKHQERQIQSLVKKNRYVICLEVLVHRIPDICSDYTLFCVLLQFLKQVYYKNIIKTYKLII